MSEPRFVSVVWWDAHGDITGDATLETVHEKHKPAVMQTRGWLLLENDVGVSLFNERDTEDGSYRGRTFIPRGMIKSIADFPPKRKPRIKKVKDEHIERTVE